MFVVLIHVFRTHVPVQSQILEKGVKYVQS